MFLHINSEESEKEIKKIIPFTVASKRIKYIEINIPKLVKDLCVENYRSVLKEIKGDLTK